MRTICTLIQNLKADELLVPGAEILADARHWSFKQIHVLGRPVKDVKRETILKFKISARHFNGIVSGGR